MVGARLAAGWCRWCPLRAGGSGPFVWLGRWVGGQGLGFRARMFCQAWVNSAV
jgi:hypothetical protein